MEEEFREWLGRQVGNQGNPYQVNMLSQDLRETIPSWDAVDCDNIFTIVESGVIHDFYQRCRAGNDLNGESMGIGNGRPMLALLKYKEFLEQRETAVEASVIDSEEEMNTLNQILYGPPGTGKTYSTVGKALEILKATEEQKQNIKSIGGLKEVFKSQVEFVTFHQSFSYEDFVEGLKAKTDDGKLFYEVEDGIFKKICKDAINSGNDSLEQLNKVIKELKEQVAGEPLELITVTYKKPFTLTCNSGKGFSAKPKAGKEESSVSISSLIELYKNPTIKDNEGGMYFRSYAIPIIKYLKDKLGLLDYQETSHVLIIDEINRGNISRIFGELITLIEPSKRAGANETISVKLPYSKTDFSVPSNLYIIGTMNTADRSLTMMDTALRRRFDFVEMLPKVDLVKGKFNNIDVGKILKVINQRIEILYDREHLIGHSFLMDIQDLSGLRNAFKNKILPLLEEYFYDDFEKIRKVLNDNGGRFYQKVEENDSLSFDNENIQKDIYKKANIDKLEAKSFQKIYE
ncbi:hypothetical protein [uncultured Gammaproteobacteria bacterium]|jgi:5-methylcytosine-specific restriction protein B|nr:hypothetical protein [uncultured Gammaproteobacteria bacterium]